MQSSRKKSLVVFYDKYGLWEFLKLLIQILLFKLSLKKSIKVKNFSPFYLRNHTSDLPVFRQVIMNGEYDFHVPFEPSVIIDLGANNGISGVFFATKFKEARIIAVEPYLPNFNQLVKNTRHIDRIKPIHAAIWSKSSHLSVLNNYVGDEWGTTVNEDESNSQSKDTVRGMTIEEIMASEKIDIIDILKVDIEGSEKELFENCGLWINKVRMIVVELHDFMKDGCSMSFINALSHLKSYSISISGENLVLNNKSI